MRSDGNRAVAHIGITDRDVGTANVLPGFFFGGVKNVHVSGDERNAGLSLGRESPHIEICIEMGWAALLLRFT